MARKGTDAELADSHQARAEAPTAARLRTHNSSLIAKILEYQLLGAIGAELLARGTILEILRTDVDADGHDVVLEANGVVRHIQLKARVQGGATRKVSCHTRLKTKPSGCIVSVTYDPATYQAVGYAVFGSVAGEALADPGNAVTRRATHNKGGERPLRLDHRDISYSRFLKIARVPDLVDWLFYSPPRQSDRDEQAFVVTRGPTGTPMSISCGSLSALPMAIFHTDGNALVVLVDRTGQRFKGRDPAVEPGIWLTLNLRDATWSCGSALDDDPVVQLLLSRTFQELAACLDASSREERE